MIEFSIRNQQRSRKLNLDLLDQIVRTILKEDFACKVPPKSFSPEVAIHILNPSAMANLNWQHLQHEGPTDVITFDYGEGTSKPSPGKPVHGDIFICLKVAEKQAEEFNTSWQSELVRYIVHGLLHLLGYDDLEPGARRIMKVQENKLVKKLERQFCLNDLGYMPRKR